MKKNNVKQKYGDCIIIEGIEYQMEAEDYDGDGDPFKESIPDVQANMMGVTSDSESREMIQEMNRADIDPTTGITEMAKMARIESIGEEDGLVKLHALTTNGVYDADVTMPLIWAKLSMSISRRGEGRKEAVDLNKNISENVEEKKMGRIKSLLTPKRKLQNENTSNQVHR